MAQAASGSPGAASAALSASGARRGQCRQVAVARRTARRCRRAIARGRRPRRSRRAARSRVASRCIGPSASGFAALMASLVEALCADDDEAALARLARPPGAVEMMLEARPTPWTSRRIGLPCDVDEALDPQDVVLRRGRLRGARPALPARRSPAGRRRSSRNRRGRALPRRRDARAARRGRPRPPAEAEQHRRRSMRRLAASTTFTARGTAALISAVTLLALVVASDRSC